MSPLPAGTPFAPPNDLRVALAAGVAERPCAIRLRDCVLRYPLGDARASFKAALFSMFRNDEGRGINADYVEALNAITLEIFPGERVALIGHNGSGKSTLLRTMAGIYPLAAGRVSLTGKLGTLLDLGLNFEPDATGRENIYYCGMAMGHSEAALKSAEAEIVEFCGLGDFIDLPTRTYSAGMHLRLGFAIATQFAPDIFLVDEVFATGDASFSKRAVGRMLSMVDRSGTFVIATHDMGLVQRLCTRAVWLSAGRIVADGDSSTVTALYAASTSQ